MCRIWVGLINSMCRSKKKEWLTTLEVVWEVDATDFRLWRNGGGSMLAAAHSLRECGVGCLLTIGIGQHRWACTCLSGVAVDATDSRPSRSGGAECRTQSARAPKSNSATAQAVCRPVDACARSSCQRMCMCVRLHVCVPAPMGACVCVCARECAHARSIGNELRNQMPCLSLS